MKSSFKSQMFGTALTVRRLLPSQWVGTCSTASPFSTVGGERSRTRWNASLPARFFVAASRQSAALFPQAVRPIPTGLCHPAQGWSEPDWRGATLGRFAKMVSTLKGLHPLVTRARNFLRRLQPRWGWGNYLQRTQGSSATLGWRLESRWDSEKEFAPTQGVLDCGGKRSATPLSRG